MFGAAKLASQATTCSHACTSVVDSAWKAAPSLSSAASLGWSIYLALWLLVVHEQKLRQDSSACCILVCSTLRDCTPIPSISSHVWCACLNTSWRRVPIRALRVRTNVHILALGWIRSLEVWSGSEWLLYVGQFRNIEMMLFLTNSKITLLCRSFPSLLAPLQRDEQTKDILSTLSKNLETIALEISNRGWKYFYCLL